MNIFAVQPGFFINRELLHLLVEFKIAIRKLFAHENDTHCIFSMDSADMDGFFFKFGMRVKAMAE
jgi:hypothetical protein